MGSWGVLDILQNTAVRRKPAGLYPKFLMPQASTSWFFFERLFSSAKVGVRNMVLGLGFRVERYGKLDAGHAAAAAVAACDQSAWQDHPLRRPLSHHCAHQTG